MGESTEKTAIKVTICQDFDEFERRHENREGGLLLPTGSGFYYTCPGCRDRSYLNINPEHGEPCWTATGANKFLTLHPSILSTPRLGGCGWHGWLRNGILTPC